MNDAKTVAAKVLDSELRYRRLFESAKDGILILDAESGMIVDVNPFLVELLGFSHENFLGKKIWELGFFKDIAANEAHFAELRAKEYVRYEDLPLETAEGRKIDVEFVSNVYLVNAHKVIQCNIRDITARKRAEESLRKSEERFRLVQELSPDGFTILRPVRDAQGCIVDFTWVYENDAVARLNGTDPKAVVGRRLLELFPGHRDSSFLKVYRQVAESGASCIFEDVYSGESMLKPVCFRIVVVPMGEDIAILAQDITVRKRAEAEAEASEADFRAMFETASIGMSLADPQTGQWLRVNQALCEITGYTAEEMLQLRISQLTHPEDRDKDWEAYQRVVRGEASDYHIEKRYMRKNGSLVWVNVNMTVIRDAAGTPTRAMATIEDITERKWAEDSLRRSEMEQRQLAKQLETERERLVTAQAVAKIGSWDTDLVTLGVVWSEETYRIFGTERATFTPSHDTFLELVHPEDRAMVEKTFVRSATQPGVHRIEHRVQMPDGRVKVVEERWRVFSDDQGQSQRACGTCQDITESRRAMESQARLVTAVEQAAETIVITDTKGKIAYANPAFEKVTGFTRAEVIGQNPRVLKSGRHSAEFYRDLWSTLVAGRVWSGRLTNRRKDGTLYEEEATISPVHDAAGKIVNFVAVKRDVTREAQLEVQLRQAQKMEAVGRLAGGVAHDFNNLLMGIMGYAEMCRDTIEAGHPIREWLDEIMLGARRSADLTRQLLAFASKQTIAPKVLDLNDAVAGMLKMLRRLIGEDIDLAFLPGANLWPVLFDPSQIDQILANLCVNARDAIAGVGKITLQTENIVIDADFCSRHTEALPGPYVSLLVCDDGCGMDAETRAQIFEPFFTTKGMGKGTGLGLATVYGIVKQNNGFICVDGEPGQGTTFRIFLPQSAAAAAEPAVSGHEERAPRGGGETVLLAEDERAPRETCRLFLESLGYNVLTAETPGEALQLAGQHAGALDLLITDVVMPGMDGRQLAKRMASVKPGISVLFMSGYTADVMAQRGVIERDMAFLAKPFTCAELAHKVREVLAGS